MFKNLFLTVALVATSLGLNAQFWEVGGGVGTAFYYGDLNTSYSLQRPGPSIGAFARYNFDTRLSVKGGLQYSYLSFSDQLSSNFVQKLRNLSFRTHVFELGGQFEFNFLPYLHGDKEKFFTPYLLGGASVIKINPQANFNDRWWDLNDLGTEGQTKNDEYSLIQPAILVGGGLKVDLNFAWSLNLEINNRVLFTDYLDDVSGNYPNLAELGNTRGPAAVALSDRSWEVSPEGIPLSEPGRQRGDGIKRDGYLTVQLSLVYNFATITCPAFKRF